MTAVGVRSSVPPANGQSSGGLTRVLLVDDDPVTLRCLGRELRGLGWEVDTAASSERGLSMAQQSTYSVVLTDLHMPSGGGFDLIREVNVANPHTSFILLTGDAGVEVPAERLFEERISSVAFKPWDPSVLNTTLRKASEQFRSRVKGSLRPREAPSLGSVLLVEDSPTDALLAESHLARVGNYQVTRVARLSDAIVQLHEANFDFVLTDLSLPDARGLDAVSRLQEAAPSSAVLVLSGMADERLSLEAVQRGAQDFLLKDRLDAYRLGSSMRFAHERKTSQLRLEQLAHEDPLTGLFNRRMFEVRLQHLIARARRANQRFAVVFLDLDHFKPINDEFGHDVGDELLKEVARRILAVVREYDTAARMGGDEFAILVENLEGAKAARDVAQRLVSSLGDPYALSGAMLRVTPSVGVAIFPDVADNEEELLNCADAAMYEVKRASRNGFQIYQGRDSIRVGEELKNDFVGALERKEFRLHYQPKWEVQTGTLVGFEALLRWKRNGVLVSPMEFIDELEKNEAMVPVGAWVVDTACERLAHWRERACNVHMAVNVSTRQFESGSMVEVVTKALGKYSLTPDSLELEITEGLLMRDTSESRKSLDALKKLGVRIAVDDFGTGYSSLAYLSRFPVDVLKIDKSFIGRLLTCDGSATITSTIVGMGHRLGLKVVAEGVENAEQMEFLRREGCDLAQGFWLGRPSEEWPKNWPELSIPPVSGRFPQVGVPGDPYGVSILSSRNHVQAGADKVSADPNQARLPLESIEKQAGLTGSEFPARTKT